MSDKILLVDDERIVRDFVRRVLEASGRAVTPAANAKEALVAANGACFDLLVSDIVMPGVDGIQLARSIQSSQPSIRVILMTGCNLTGRNDGSLALEDNWKIMRKPFLPAELIASVQEVLVSSDGGG